MALRLTGILLLLSVVSSAAEKFDSRTVLQHLPNASETPSTDLKSFVCDEHIRRFRSALDGSHARPIDTVEASLSFENGMEHYSGIRRNSLTLAGLSNLAGAWSEGEFGTLLRQTLQLLRAEAVTFGGIATWGNESTLLYSFDVPAEDSPWDLVIDGHSYRLAFHTDVWVNAATEQVVRVVRTAPHLDPLTGVSEIQWSVALRPVRMLGQEWLLPATAQYSVSYAHYNRREWNEIEFAHYRRYGSEVALRFDLP